MLRKGSEEILKVLLHHASLVSTHAVDFAGLTTKGLAHHGADRRELFQLLYCEWLVDRAIKHDVGAKTRPHPVDVFRIAPARVHTKPPQPVIEGILENKTAGSLEWCSGNDRMVMVSLVK